MATHERNHTSSTSGQFSSAERAASRVGQEVRDTAKNLSENAAKAGQGLQEGMDAFKEKFNEARDTVVEKTKDYARVTNNYVNENPWIAVGISTGIGFLLGMMITNRRSNQLP